MMARAKTMMEDVRLAKWLREELPHLIALNRRQSSVVDALTALVALLREVETAIETHMTVLHSGTNSDPLNLLLVDLLARLRVVLGEGR